METTKSVSSTLINFTVIFSIITIPYSVVAASLMSFQQPAISPERALYVSEPTTFEFNGMEDSEWVITTQTNRILFFSFSDVESSEYLKDSLKIYDGSGALIYPSTNDDLNTGKAIHDRFYSTGNTVLLRFGRSESLKTTKNGAKHQLKIQKAVPCPVNLGGSSSCGRIVDEVSCYCATFTGRTWANTRAFCLENQMTFLRIDGYDEDFQVYSTWGGAQQLWIGASDTSKEGNFTWDNGGRPVSPGYTNWGANQPDNASEEDCVHYWNDAFWWNDKQCGILYGGICEGQPTN